VQKIHFVRPSDRRATDALKMYSIKISLFTFEIDTYFCVNSIRIHFPLIFLFVENDHFFFGSTFNYIINLLLYIIIRY